MAARSKIRPDVVFVGNPAEDIRGEPGYRWVSSTGLRWAEDSTMC